MLTIALPWRDPETIFARFASQPYAAWLDSQTGGRRARYSTLAPAPYAVLLPTSYRPAAPEPGGFRPGLSAGLELPPGPGLAAGLGLPPPRILRVGDPFGALRHLLRPAALGQRAKLAGTRSTGSAAPEAASPGPAPFSGGAIGFLGYECGALLEAVPRHPFAGPDFCIGLHDVLFSWDHQENRLTLISTGLPETAPSQRQPRAEERAAALLAMLETAPPSAALPRAGAAGAQSGRPDAAATAMAHRLSQPPALAFQPLTAPAEQKARIARAIRYIEAGDIFQANITTAFRAPLPAAGDRAQGGAGAAGSVQAVGAQAEAAQGGAARWGAAQEEAARLAAALHLRLRARNPAPFGAFLGCGPGFALASVSPERFLRLSAEGEVEARPIKGSRKRGADPALDAAEAAALLASAKDRAENLMITDLLRNDIGRVAQIGSISVPELAALETFPRIHHLVSCVRGRLRPGATAADLLRASFPGGSITGAPKIRAIEIIHELEQAARGPYCGSLFWIGTDGAMDSSILIRTAVITPESVTIQAGGGIVSDSDPEREYEECLLKVGPLLEALSG